MLPVLCSTSAPSFTAVGPATLEKSPSEGAIQKRESAVVSRRQIQEVRLRLIPHVQKYTGALSARLRQPCIDRDHKFSRTLQVGVRYRALGSLVASVVSTATFVADRGIVRIRYGAPVRVCASTSRCRRSFKGYQSFLTNAHYFVYYRNIADISDSYS